MKKKILVELTVENDTDTITRLEELKSRGLEAKIIEDLPVLFADFNGGTDPIIMLFSDHDNAKNSLLSLYNEKLPTKEDKEGNEVDFNETFFSSPETIGRIDYRRIW